MVHIPSCAVQWQEISLSPEATQTAIMAGSFAAGLVAANVAPGLASRIAALFQGCRQEHQADHNRNIILGCVVFMCLICPPLIALVVPIALTAMALDLSLRSY